MATAGAYTWDDPRTAAYYDWFYDLHPRYREANEALVAAAGLPDPQRRLRVLDVAAGTGRTAELTASTRLTCYEPAAAMRERGMQRVPGADWTGEWPSGRSQLFDRILCGAAIWQLLPMEETLDRLDRLLAPGGQLVLNIPTAYLGEPDAAGGGRDPLLTEIWNHISPPVPQEEEASQHAPLPSAGMIDRALLDRGLNPCRWQFRSRLTQREYHDWLKIPVLTNRLFDGMEADERAARIDRAFAQCDPDSWRWESWSGWTCIKEGGHLLARGLVGVETVRELREAAVEVCRGRGWIDSNGTPTGPEEDLSAQAELQSHPAFGRLREDPALVGLLEGVFDAPVNDRQGDVWRIVFPNRPDLTTPPHCDATYIGREREVWIAWIPLTDCPIELGPLAVENSRGEWVPQPMREGDVLLVRSTTMHRALDNVSGRLRLSVDFRYAALHNAAGGELRRAGERRSSP